MKEYTCLFEDGKKKAENGVVCDWFITVGGVALDLLLDA
jgi:hypothetical protein